MTSLDDLLTAAKNLVAAVNNAAQTYLNVNGATVSTAITTATVVKAAAGRVCTVSVVVAGSTTGKIYDATSASATTGLVYTIPNTTGAYVVNMPTLYGIVVAPGSGQTVTLGWS